MNVEIIVPWGGYCPARARAWNWCRSHYGHSVRVAQHRGKDWIKALAVMPAIQDSAAEIVVVADADVTTPGLEEAIEAVRDGAPWAVPHERVHRLSERSTEMLFHGAEFPLPTEQKPYFGVEGGGCIVARRETLLEVPMDPRFVGWGQEDLSWGLALNHLAGERWRGTAPLYHLWHPHPERMDRKFGSYAGRELYRRYCRARRSTDQMRALVEEAKRDFPAHQQGMHAEQGHGHLDRLAG